MKSKMMVHKGVEYLYVDYSNFGSDFAAFQKEAQTVNEFVLQRPLNSTNELIDTRNTVISVEVSTLLKNNATTARPHLRKVAVLGMVGIRTVIAKAITNISGLGFTAFDDIEKAKDWLVKEN